MSSRPFKVVTSKRECMADTVIIATGAIARRLEFPGSGETDGFWNKGISACAVCDGAMPMFRNRPIAVIGGGDSAMEEANFLTKYGSKVYIVHRRDTLRASKVMQRRAQNNAKIEILWNSVVEKASGDDEDLLASITVKNLKTGETKDVPVSGLFFAIGHEPATEFLSGQVQLDDEKYVLTKPGSTATNVPGVFAAGDVQDKKWRQAITAAGTGICLYLADRCADYMSLYFVSECVVFMVAQMHLHHMRVIKGCRLSSTAVESQPPHHTWHPSRSSCVLHIESLKMPLIGPNSAIVYRLHGCAGG